MGNSRLTRLTFWGAPVPARSAGRAPAAPTRLTGRGRTKLRAARGMGTEFHFFSAFLVEGAGRNPPRKGGGAGFQGFLFLGWGGPVGDPGGPGWFSA